MKKTCLIFCLILLLNVSLSSLAWASLIDVRVTVACDEEWIKIYGEHWRQAALNAIEEADKELGRQFSINLLVDSGSYVQWKSNNWELNLGDLLDEAYRENAIKLNDDILLAFTGQRTDYVGMAYVSGRACIMMHQNPVYDAIVTRHEVSHLFGCRDEDPPAKSIMSEWWDYPNLWSRECHETISVNRERYVR